MKAKVQATGEIVNVFFNGKQWCSETDDGMRLFNGGNLDFDYEKWDSFRANAAKDILCAILTGGAEQSADDGTVFRTTEQIVDYAICAADALIKKLREEK